MNRVKRMLNWVKEFYPGHYEQVCYDLSEQDKKDVNRFYHNNEQDFKYNLLKYNVMEAFVVAHKIKNNGKYVSYSHLRKFYDALLFGADQSGKYLRNDFTENMDSLFDCLKKESINALKQGNLDSEDATAINLSLYRKICVWAVENNNIFVWTYTVMLWNCMARSINIESIGLNNMAIGTTDSIE